MQQLTIFSNLEFSIYILCTVSVCVTLIFAVHILAGRYNMRDVLLQEYSPFLSLTIAEILLLLSLIFFDSTESPTFADFFVCAFVFFAVALVEEHLIKKHILPLELLEID